MKSSPNLIDSTAKGGLVEGFDVAQSQNTLSQNTADTNAGVGCTFRPDTTT